MDCSANYIPLPLEKTQLLVSVTIKGNATQMGGVVLAQIQHEVLLEGTLWAQW